MITIPLQCHNSCKHYWDEVKGYCPHYIAIQDALLAMDKTMLHLHPEHEKLASPVRGDHWLGKCVFECRFYEAKPGEITFSTIEERRNHDGLHRPPGNN